jgi:hypothetical protein
MKEEKRRTRDQKYSIELTAVACIHFMILAKPPLLPLPTYPPTPPRGGGRPPPTTMVAHTVQMCHIVMVVEQYWGSGVGCESAAEMR